MVDKVRFLIGEESDGTELGYPVEHEIQSEDLPGILLNDIVIASGDTVTIPTGKCAIIKRYLKIKGTLIIEGTGKVGIV